LLYSAGKRCVYGADAKAYSEYLPGK